MAATELAPARSALVNGHAAPPSPEALVAHHYRELFARASKAVTFRIELVTPARAEQMLEKNEHNRPLSLPYAREYGRAITGGEWRVNGQSVILDSTGEVLDGQHRLRGVVLSGIAVPMLVISGVDRETFCTIDQGRKRDFSGYLAMDGKGNSTSLASAVRYVRFLLGGDTGGKPTIASLYATLKEHPGVETSLAYIAKHRKRKIVFLGPHSAMHYVTTQKHPTDATRQFWDHFLTQAGVPTKSPVYRLLQTLQDEATSKGKIIPPRGVLAYTIKAFNATTLGKPLGLLRWHGDQAFPKLV